ncbi:MAG: tycC, partial [Eubacterium sp.]|nr:tycC [Eubacterium sp.]
MESKTFELLSQLGRKSINIQLDGDKMRVTAPDGALTVELREQLAEHKLEIIEFLKNMKTNTHFEPLVHDESSLYDPFGMTDIQQAYWLGRSSDFEMGNISTHMYHEYESIGLDIDRLEKAWQKLIQRHDMLRAIIRPDGQQQILKEVPLYKLKRLNLKGTEKDYAEKKLQDVRDELSHQVLPSDTWPLFDIRATSLDNNIVRLHVSIDLLIADARSCQLLIWELAQLYMEPDKKLPPINISFRDCIIGSEEIEKSDLFQRSLKYWKQRAASIAHGPVLPLAVNPKAITKPHFVRKSRKIASETWNRIKETSTKHGITPSTALMTAFAHVLSTWSKKPVFSLNLTLFNRIPRHEAINNVVGDFTSLTLLEIDNSKEIPFIERAHRVQERMWQDLDHRHVSGIRVMREMAQIAGTREGISMPVVFTSEIDSLEQDIFISGEDEMDVSVMGIGKEIYAISQTPQVWIDHQVFEQRGVLTYNWDVAIDLFPEGMIDNAFDAYYSFIMKLSESEDVWNLTPFQIMDKKEGFIEDSFEEAPLSNEMLHTLFLKQVIKKPENTAVVSGNRSLTYEEVYRLSSQLADILKKKGAEVNKPVAVVVEKSWQQVVAVLGVLLSGAAYLPISSEVPRDRLDNILKHAGVSIIVTNSNTKEKFNLSDIEAVCIDGLETEAYASVMTEILQKPGDLAYIIYTSGSTGQPKGVMIDHRGAVNTILDVNSRFGISDKDSALAVSALGFDLSVYDIFGMLASGGKIVIPDEAERLDPAKWNELVTEHGVTVWNTVPALMEMYVEYCEGEKIYLPHSLRLALLSGDWIPLNLADRIKARANDIRVISLGGATEGSIWSILYPIDKVDLQWKSIPYGKAMKNQRMLVLDHLLEHRPVWVPGEIYIGGVGVAKGYWMDDQRTKESFITHPVTGEYFYKTGDLGRYMPDGNIEFLGREDTQVKIGGHRIELGEIESVFGSHPDIKSCVVTVSGEGTQRNKRLIAYYVAENTSVEIDDLKKYITEKLPNYMVPAVFQKLTSMPLSANGKIDRKAMPDVDIKVSDSEKTYVAPRTSFEKEVARILAEEIGCERVGITDNFFELGGDSILAVKFLLRIKQETNVVIPVKMLFENSTIQELAASVNIEPNIKSSEAELPVIKPNRKEAHKPFPLTGLQQAYLVGRSDAVAMGNVACHTYEEIDAYEYDLKRFEKAWNKLIKRHDVLRTVILHDGMQKVLEDIPEYEIPVLDMQGSPEDKVNKELLNIRERMSHQVIDIHTWPLFEILATKLDNGITRLHISIDAMIADAWSVGILTREVSDLYRNENLELEPLEISFRDYVVNEHSLKDTEVYKSSLKYWLDRLPDFPPAPQLPLKTNFESIKRPEFVRRRTELDPDTWRRLKANASKVGITPAGIMLSAFSEILTIWNTLNRFVINVPQFNRLPLHQQVDNLVGEFASFYLLEVNNQVKDTFAERARRVQNQLWEDMNNCYVSGVQVVRELTKVQGGLPNVAMPIVFTSTIGLINHEESSLLEGIGNIVYSISQTPQVWLDCQVGEKGDGLLFNWDAVDELFPDGLLDDMFDAYRNLLDLLAQNPDAWLFEEFRLIPEKQLSERESANSYTMEVPDVLLHKMFEEAAAAYPHRNAVISATRTLDYEELNSITNRLAKKLIELGAQPDKLVAIVMDKGWEQIAAVMAILKSGAACVPIDADSPSDRLLYLIENSQAEIILTQSSLNKTLKWPENKIRLEVDTIDLSGMAEENLPQLQNQDNLAYVIYTSGSTGLPKGVMISHKNVVNVVLYTNRELNITCKDKAIHLTPLHHDLAMYDIFGILAAGGALVIPDASLKKDPKHWSDIMMRENVTFWNTVPAMMEMLITFVQGREGLVPSSFRQVILGGDWVPLYIPDKLRELVPNINILSIGGPTETTIWNIWHRIGSIDPVWKSIPYGKPIANSKYFVLDHLLRDKPCYVSGEMYCSGIQVSSGYWKDEEKTAKSFIVHPLSGERIYKTGDLGRYMPDGNIEFIGRADFQVKINGVRIELGEIESAISKLPDVKACIVNVAGEGNARRLVGYIVTENAENPSDTGRGEVDSLTENLTSEGIIADPIERLEFKQKHIAIKNYKNKAAIQLTGTLKEDSINPYIERRSYRNFEKELLKLEDFGKFLATTSKVDFEGMPFPKYRYASAGGLYPVQTYVVVKPERIEGLQGGAYYYNPYENKLYLVTQFEQLASDIFPPGNKDIYEEAAFATFLIADLDAIKPMYGSLTNNFCLIEAGIITQLLEMASIECGIGLCQIGSVGFDKLRPLFELSDSQIYLHCILGGKTDNKADKMEALMKDWGGYKLSLGHKEKAGDFVEGIKNMLADILPTNMIPSDYIVMKEFPLTANGKIDRTALSLMVDMQKQEKNFVAPSTPIEKKLAEVLCQSLRQENISVLDNLFELGADSLMAIQLISQVRQIFKIELPLKQLFAAPTVKGIAKEIELLGGQADESSQEEFGRFNNNLTELINDPENRYEPFPLTDVQQAYWVGRNSFVELGNIATHVYMEMEQKNFDLDRFQWAWRQIIQRHEMLRAVVRNDGQQQILEAVPEYIVEVLDLSGINQEEAAVKLDEIRERMSHQVLPADKWPLFEIKATKLRNGKIRLHVSMDLLISDVWSARIISREITQLYLTGEQLTPLELSFRDYVIADTKLRKTEIYNKSLEYWRKRLSKLPPAPMLPLAKNPAELTKPRFERRIASIEKERWDKLKNYSTTAGITQSGMLVAAYAEILASWSKNPRFTLNLTLFNRLPFAPQVN